MRVASIDIGTNTFRVLIGDVRGGEFKRLYIDRMITRLGGGFTGEEKMITQDAALRGLSALRRFSEVLKKNKVDKVRAVATSVVRESANGGEFVERVRRETGIGVEVISGEEEARLTVDGVLKSVSIPSGYGVIFDIGGGSTEYVFVKRNTIVGLRSTNLGIVHLTERFLKKEMPSESDIKTLSSEVERVLTSELSWIPSIDGDSLTLVGTAGTPTTLAAIELGLERYDSDLVNGFSLRREGVLRVYEKLLNLPVRGRLEIKGMESGREDVIIAGILILLETMRRFSKDEVLVSDGGLLEGVAYSIIT